MNETEEIKELRERLAKFEEEKKAQEEMKKENEIKELNTDFREPFMFQKILAP